MSTGIQRTASTSSSGGLQRTGSFARTISPGIQRTGSTASVESGGGWEVSTGIQRTASSGGLQRKGSFARTLRRTASCGQMADVVQNVSRARPVLRNSSSAGNLHANGQPDAQYVSPRGKEQGLVTHDLFQFKPSALMPTRTASEEGPLRSGTAPSRTPEGQRTSSAEPVRRDTSAVQFCENSGKESTVINASQTSLKQFQETNSSKLRGNLVQSSFLEKKLATFKLGGIQVLPPSLCKQC